MMTTEENTSYIRATLQLIKLKQPGFKKVIEENTDKYVEAMLILCQSMVLDCDVIFAVLQSISMQAGAVAGAKLGQEATERIIEELEASEKEISPQEVREKIAEVMLSQEVQERILMACLSSLSSFISKYNLSYDHVDAFEIINEISCSPEYNLKIKAVTDPIMKETGLEIMESIENALQGKKSPKLKSIKH